MSYRKVKSAWKISGQEWDLPSKRHKYILNHVNVFLLTIKKRIMKKHPPTRRGRMRRKLVSAGILLALGGVSTYGLGSSANSWETERAQSTQLMRWPQCAVCASAITSQGFWASAQLKCLPARCVSFTTAQSPLLPTSAAGQDAHDPPSSPVTRILQQLPLILWEGRRGRAGQLSKLLLREEWSAGGQRVGTDTWPVAKSSLENTPPRYHREIYPNVNAASFKLCNHGWPFFPAIYTLMCVPIFF